VFQAELEESIMRGRTKYDFSGFDIFQHAEKKEALIKRQEEEYKINRLVKFKEILMKAEKQILFFSGNLSFINLDDDEINVFEVLEKLIRKGISIKVVCRVDIAGRDNLKKLLSLNHKYGRELIEIHHREQPLRVSIIDNKLFDMKEIKEHTGKDKELKVKTHIFYTIMDREWVEWISRIFWKMFNSSIDAGIRMKEMDKIKV
jgi:hypothetical protein